MGSKQASQSQPKHTLRGGSPAKDLQVTVTSDDGDQMGRFEGEPQSQ